MAPDLKWYGPEIDRKVVAGMRRNLAAAAIYLANHAKVLISRDGTGRGKGKGKGKLRYNANPSAPGEPPRVQTGHLRRSVAWDWLGVLAVGVGTNIKYGRRLELGTRYMKARPWLRRALAECRGVIARIVTKPLN